MYITLKTYGKRGEIDFMIVKDFLRINHLYLSELSRTNKAFFIYRVLLIGLSVLTSQVTLYFPKLFFDAITERADFTRAIILLVGYLLFLLIEFSLVNVFNILIDIINEDVKYHLQQSVIRKIYEMPYEKFDDPVSYDQIKRSIEFVESGRYQLLDILAGLVTDILSLAATIYVMGQLNIWVLVFLALSMVVEYIVNLLRDKEVFRAKRKLTRMGREMGYLFQLVSKKENLQDLKISNSYPFVSKKYESLYRKTRKDFVRLKARIGFLKLPTKITDALFTGGIYGFLGWDLVRGQITVGSFTMLLNAANHVKAYIMTIQMAISDLRQAALDAQNFYEVFAQETDPRPPRLPLPESWEGKPYSIEFDHVSFTYPGQTEPVIQDLSFKIQASQRVVMIGENGAGKSTIIKLMLGLYNPDKGRVLINGKNLEQLDKKEFYHTVGAVFQDHREFAFTIAENVLMDFENEKNREAVYQALTSVGLMERTASAPLKEKTPLTRELSEEGVDFSGGERQKLAIARAYMKQGGLLVMDEPSSALDVFSEQELFHHVTVLSRSQTAVVITHRVLSLQGFDQIFYIKEGAIMESGTHEELMERNGLYKKMVQAQKTSYDYDTSQQ